jgi:hypothetical protein
MIYLPNKLTQDEISYAIEIIEQTYSPVLSIIPNTVLTEKERDARNSAKPTRRFGETSKLLNTLRLLARPNQGIELREQAIEPFLALVKDSNPSISTACPYGQIPVIQTNLPLLGAALDRTVKYAVEKRDIQKVDLSVTRRDSVRGDFKYPERTRNSSQGDFVSFNVFCEGRLFSDETECRKLFSTDGGPLFLLGAAAKMFEGVISIASADHGTTIALYHPVYNSQ